MTKPTKWLCTQRRLRSAWGSAQSDQSSLSARRKLGSLATHWAHNQDSYQTGHMPRLIWVFPGRTCHCAGFVMRRLMYFLTRHFRTKFALQTYMLLSTWLRPGISCLYHACNMQAKKKKRFYYHFTCLQNLSSNFKRLFLCHVNCIKWTASSEFGTYRLCEQWRFRRACASAQSRQNLRCSLTQAVNQEEPSDRKPDPWPLWMAGHAQLKFVMTECSKSQIRLTGPKY